MSVKADNEAAIFANCLHHKTVNRGGYSVVAVQGIAAATWHAPAKKNGSKKVNFLWNIAGLMDYEVVRRGAETNERKKKRKRKKEKKITEEKCSLHIQSHIQPFHALCSDTDSTTVIVIQCGVLFHQAATPIAVGECGNRHSAILSRPGLSMPSLFGILSTRKVIPCIWWIFSCSLLENCVLLLHLLQLHAPDWIGVKQ